MDEQPLSAREFGAAFKGFLEQAVTETPEEGSIFLRRIRDHLGVDPTSLSVVSQEFEGTDHPNVQVALDAYLEPDTRTVELLGFASPFAGYQPVTLATLLAKPRSGPMAGPSVDLGPVQYVEVDVGSDEVLACIESALLLLRTESGPLVVLIAAGAEYGPRSGKVIVQALAAERERADRFLADLRTDIRRRNVFRGQVISLEKRQFGPPKVRFHALAEISRAQIVLPAGVLERVERQTVGFAAHADRLRAASRHLRRGLLLHGPPGTGKTLTAMYIVGRMPGRTTILLTGEALGLIEPSVTLARVLQPSLVILEDVDLIAEERTEQSVGTNAVLFELLNQMDGLADDADVIFLLTSNRPELLEPALASRPGRIDQPVEIPLPDADCRRRLFSLYSAGMRVEADDLDGLVERTRGVTGAFIRELLRKAALFAADEGDELVVRDRHLDEALHDLVVEGGELTKTLLGGPEASA
jgi:ATPase family associated with various cellular activities (AAA)/AAA+ lid domain